MRHYSMNTRRKPFEALRIIQETYRRKTSRTGVKSSLIIALVDPAKSNHRKPFQQRATTSELFNARRFALSRCFENWPEHNKIGA